ncbi:hybrid sensor histidine kinase/response regulator [Pseudoduganella dura]|uniref:hybrid sensor histidine kinase/response regulator n=1 Tax=Pseudoduganella dura TaxID=321982 RepID=UPI0019B7DEBF|nr:hypothetical protein [Pseudoduganella dura]GGX78189.1 hypothetical protein GCM10007386_06440 [Pseudoduganella dura]
MGGAFRQVWASALPVVGDAFDRAHRNSLRLLKLVNSLLDFSRIEAGRATATYVPLDLARLTTDLAGVFDSAMEKGGLQYRIDIEDLGELQQAMLVALTGWGTEQDRRRSREAGLDARLTKPVDLASIDALLREAAAQRAN